MAIQDDLQNGYKQLDNQPITYKAFSGDITIPVCVYVKIYDKNEKLLSVNPMAMNFTQYQAMNSSGDMDFYITQLLEPSTETDKVKQAIINNNIDVSKG